MIADFLSIEPSVKLAPMIPGLMGWGTLPTALGRSVQLIEATKDLGQDGRALRFLIVGLAGETAVFSLVADLEGKEWATFKRAAL